MAEEIMGRRVTNLFDWKCIPDVISVDNHSLADAWMLTLQALLPQLANIMNDKKRYGENSFYEIPRSIEKSRDVANHLRATLASISSVIKSQFAPIRDRTRV